MYKSFGLILLSLAITAICATDSEKQSPGGKPVKDKRIARTSDPNQWKVACGFNSHCNGGQHCCNNQFCCTFGQICCNSGCCPTGTRCCGIHCCQGRQSCCGNQCCNGGCCANGGCCPANHGCCPNTGLCCQIGHTCCANGGCCPPATQCYSDGTCRPINGKRSFVEAVKAIPAE